MRHLKHGRKLNRTASHRKAMLANLATSIFEKERVKTTLAKAKEVRSVVERLITYGKKGGLHQVRLAGKTVEDKTVLKKLFDVIAPRYKDREGGYTRIIKMGERKGDNALMSIIELVGADSAVIRRKRKSRPDKAAAATPDTIQATDQAANQSVAPKAEASEPAADSAPEKEDSAKA